MRVASGSTRGLGGAVSDSVRAPCATKTRRKSDLDVTEQSAGGREGAVCALGEQSSQVGRNLDGAEGSQIRSGW